MLPSWNMITRGVKRTVIRGPQWVRDTTPGASAAPPWPLPAPAGVTFLEATTLGAGDASGAAAVGSEVQVPEPQLRAIVQCVSSPRVTNEINQ